MVEGVSAISRRPARIFTDYQDANEAGSYMLSKSRSPSVDERDGSGGDYKVSITSPTYIMPAVNLGIDISGIFTNTQEEMGKQGTYTSLLGISLYTHLYM